MRGSQKHICSDECSRTELKQALAWNPHDHRSYERMGVAIWLPVGDGLSRQGRDKQQDEYRYESDNSSMPM
jgi:hypothetical protein